MVNAVCKLCLNEPYCKWVEDLKARKVSYHRR